MPYKKVKAEVVDQHGAKVKKEHKIVASIRKFLVKAKLGVAIVIDIIDFAISWIPIVNTLFDFVTFAVLLITLRNKQLAFYSLGELIIPGLGPIGLIDGFIPAATILTLLDIAMSRH